MSLNKFIDDGTCSGVVFDVRFKDVAVCGNLDVDGLLNPPVNIGQVDNIENVRLAIGGNASSVGENDISSILWAPQRDSNTGGFRNIILGDGCDGKGDGVINIGSNTPTDPVNEIGVHSIKIGNLGETVGGNCVIIGHDVSTLNAVGPVKTVNTVAVGAANHCQGVDGCTILGSNNLIASVANECTIVGRGIICDSKECVVIKDGMDILSIPAGEDGGTFIQTRSGKFTLCGHSLHGPGHDTTYQIYQSKVTTLAGSAFVTFHTQEMVNDSVVSFEVSGVGYSSNTGDDQAFTFKYFLSALKNSAGAVTHNKTTVPPFSSEALGTGAPAALLVSGVDATVVGGNLLLNIQSSEADAIVDYRINVIVTEANF